LRRQPRSTAGGRLAGGQTDFRQAENRIGMKIPGRIFCQTRDSGQIFGYELLHQGAWQTQICRWIRQ